MRDRAGWSEERRDDRIEHGMIVVHQEAHLMPAPGWLDQTYSAYMRDSNGTRLSRGLPV